MILALHLIGIAVYVLAIVAMAVASIRARRLPSHPERLALLARAFGWLDPLIIAVLGLVLMTGAFSLTATKARFGPEFFARVGGPLAWKLGLVFVLVLAGTWVVFGIAHRIVRAQQWGDPLPPERLAGMLSRLRAGAFLNLALTAWIVWISITMPR